MRKSVYAICEQQRRRSACVSVQSDQCLCCSLLGQYNTTTCYSQNFKTLANPISWAGRFESFLVANPEDRFSRDKAQLDRVKRIWYYHLCEQRRFRRACASAQSRQNLRYSLIQAVNQEEPSDRKPGPWPLWMAGHAQLKSVMTECSKTQIRLTGLN